ncbi:uncharacterized protein LOC131281812 [Anopheles ziemanni]|nr:uncharacterized protein LOC131281812 [Anopheles ziemanni]
MKCRLCLCFVDKQIGYASLIDQTFHNMVKRVMNFSLPTENSTASIEYSLPVLVCNQCCKTVQDFYSFSKMVEANQEKLRSEGTGLNKTTSIDEFLHYIKPDPDQLAEACNDILNDSHMMSIEADPLERAGGIYSPTTGQRMQREFTAPRERPSTCVDKGEVMHSITEMEKRINSVKTKLDAVLRKMPSPESEQAPGPSPTIHPNIVEFNPITTEAQLIEFNTMLSKKEFLHAFLEWLNKRIAKAHSGEQRMHEALDLIFSRPFFANCSWTGTSTLGIQKVGLYKFTQVLNIFRTIGSNMGQQLTDDRIRSYFRGKLRKAKDRLKLQGIRKSTCRPVRKY